MALFGFKSPVKPFPISDHCDLSFQVSLTSNSREMGWESLISSFPESLGSLCKSTFSSVVMFAQRGLRGSL